VTPFGFKLQFPLQAFVNYCYLNGQAVLAAIKVDAYSKNVIIAVNNKATVKVIYLQWKGLLI